MPETEEQELVDFGNRVIGKIDKKPLDITPYIGRRVKIERIDENIGRFGYFIKILTSVVSTLGEGERKIELRGSRIFGLAEDAKSNLGWEFSDGSLTRLGEFLKKYKVSHYKDLIGKEVILQSQTSKGQDYLTFN